MNSTVSFSFVGTLEIIGITVMVATLLAARSLKSETEREELLRRAQQELVPVSIAAILTTILALLLLDLFD